ncbi:ABC transporter permease [Streptomyces sp. TS71-3]|uniref:ABC transporter permease n=1 Tax=Streptomyces sp. TS71-3 TaxID=2733862 RepID=UPI001B1C3FC5|nr:ABC transporter permease [Streptomyces sp. TS71-3]GHJ38964.1 peptide ABC transporter permease [Streptomyces sp. TS71-3]
MSRTLDRTGRTPAPDGARGPHGTGGDTGAADPGKPRRRRRGLVSPALAAVYGALGVLVLLTVFAPGLLAPYEPNDTHVLSAFQAPGAAHPFGTDELGRDVLSRVIHGARTSLTIGVGASAIGVVGGALVGLLAAVGGSRTDQVLMRAMDVLLAFPELLLALLVVSVVGAGAGNVLAAIGLAAVPNYARLVRAQALVVLRSGYVEAAVVLGAGRGTIVLRHVLPNVAGPLLVLATIGTGTAVVSGAALSFLGLGPAPPTAEWGAMLSEGREYLATAWWVGVFPGVAVAAVVLSLTLLGRHLKSRADTGEPS